MAGIAVKDLDSAGGAQLGGRQDFVTVGGKLVIVQGDAVEPHPPLPPHTTSPVMAEGCDWLTINGNPVCRDGHKANCGHPTTGRDWVQVIG